MSLEPGAVSLERKAVSPGGDDLYIKIARSAHLASLPFSKEGGPEGRKVKCAKGA